MGSNRIKLCSFGYFEIFSIQSMKSVIATSMDKEDSLRRVQVSSVLKLIESLRKVPLLVHFCFHIASLLGT